MLDGGPRASADPLRDYPCTPAVAELGLGSYAGVPVYDAEGGMYGTLCAASTRARQLDDRTVRVMELIGDESLAAHARPVVVAGRFRVG